MIHNVIQNQFVHSLIPSFSFVSKQWRPQAIVFEIVTDKKFDMVIMLFIGFNMLTMTMDHYQQSQEFSNVLDYLNMIFICIFTSECLMKIFALRYHYFVEPWNFFDLIVVTLSILSKYRECIKLLTNASLEFKFLPHRNAFHVDFLFAQVLH